YVCEVHSVHLPNDEVRVRGYHLGSIFEIDLVSIIVWRVMTRCYHYTSRGFEVTHSKTQVRRRAGPLENVGAPSQTSKGRSGQLTKMAGEVAHVVCDNNARLFFASVFGQIARTIAVETYSSSYDIKVIQIGRADGRMS